MATENKTETNGEKRALKKFVKSLVICGIVVMVLLILIDVLYKKVLPFYGFVIFDYIPLQILFRDVVAGIVISLLILLIKKSYELEDSISRSSKTFAEAKELFKGARDLFEKIGKQIAHEKIIHRIEKLQGYFSSPEDAEDNVIKLLDSLYGSFPRSSDSNIHIRKLLAKMWKEYIREEYVDHIGKGKKDGVIKIRQEKRLNKMDVVDNDDVPELPSLIFVSNLKLYLSVLKAAVETFMNTNTFKKDEKWKAILIGSTPVLPEDWYNWPHYRDSERKSNEFIDAYREILYFNREKIEIYRFICIVENDNQRNILPGQSLKTMGELKTQSKKKIRIHNDKARKYGLSKEYISYFNSCYGDEKWQTMKGCYASLGDAYIIGCENEITDGECSDCRKLIDYFTEECHSSNGGLQYLEIKELSDTDTFPLLRDNMRAVDFVVFGFIKNSIFETANAGSSSSDKNTSGAASDRVFKTLNKDNFRPEILIMSDLDPVKDAFWMKIELLTDENNKWNIFNFIEYLKKYAKPMSEVGNEKILKG